MSTAQTMRAVLLAMATVMTRAGRRSRSERIQVPAVRDRLGRISKMGDGYLRKLLGVAATSVIRRARTATVEAMKQAAIGRMTTYKWYGSSAF